MNLLKPPASDHKSAILWHVAVAPLSQAAKLAVPTKTDSAKFPRSTNQGLGPQLLPFCETALVIVRQDN